MKNLIKTSLIAFSMFALAACQKTEFIPVSPATEKPGENQKLHQDGIDVSNGNLFTDTDKCKKCHTGKTMGIDWNAPYMSDNRYNSIEELVADFDFANNVHLKNAGPQNISNEQKQELIDYLNNIASQALTAGK